MADENESGKGAGCETDLLDRHHGSIDLEQPQDNSQKLDLKFDLRDQTGRELD